MAQRNLDTTPAVSLPTTDVKEARKSIIGAVLATDMAQHFNHLGRLKSRLEARQAGTPFSAADPLDRQVSESPEQWLHVLSSTYLIHVLGCIRSTRAINHFSTRCCSR